MLQVQKIFWERETEGYSDEEPTNGACHEVKNISPHIRLKLCFRRLISEQRCCYLDTYSTATSTCTRNIHCAWNHFRYNLCTSADESNNNCRLKAFGLFASRCVIVWTLSPHNSTKIYRVSDSRDEYEIKLCKLHFFFFVFYRIVSEREISLFAFCWYDSDGTP